MGEVVSFQACPDCEGRDIRTEVVTEEFPYGLMANPTMIKVTLPVRHCNSCEYEWTDHEGEQARAAAVRVHFVSRKDTCG